MTNNITSLQPYIIICGPLRCVQSSYIIIDKAMHQCESPLIAVDLCFKIFYSLHVDYSVGCPQIWSFFHISFYEIKGMKSTVAASKILDLRSEVYKIPG